MSVLEIPTRTDISLYDFTVELDGVVFLVSLTYNTRAQRWFFSLSDADGTPLRQGIKMVANWELTQTWVQQGRPAGGLYAINAENDADPVRETLGTDAVFSYDEGGKLTDG